MDGTASTAYVNLSINTTSIPTKCDLQPENPWCGQFGFQQIFEIIYLATVSIVGTVGNLIVIFSIILDGKAHKRGNVFIINLAIADLIVTGLLAPTTIANVIESTNVLSVAACRAFGFVTVISCLCSVYNLAFIALNRYWAIVRPATYRRRFSTMHVYLMAAFIWLWSNLLALPTLVDWSDLKYNYNIMLCTFDETSSVTYNIFLIILGIFLPLATVATCYGRLYAHVRETRQNLQSIQGSIAHKSLQREISLLKTLITTVLVFIVFWTPYGFFMILSSVGTADPVAAKAVTWLGVINSAVNFIIYGLMNKGYRKGYKKLFIYILCYKDRKDYYAKNLSSGSR